MLRFLHEAGLRLLCVKKLLVRMRRFSGIKDPDTEYWKHHLTTVVFSSFSRFYFIRAGEVWRVSHCAETHVPCAVRAIALSKRRVHTDLLILGEDGIQYDETGRCFKDAYLDIDLYQSYQVSQKYITSPRLRNCWRYDPVIAVLDSGYVDNALLIITRTGKVWSETDTLRSAWRRLKFPETVVQLYSDMGRIIAVGKSGVLYSYGIRSTMHHMTSLGEVPDSDRWCF